MYETYLKIYNLRLFLSKGIFSILKSSSSQKQLIQLLFYLMIEDDDHFKQKDTFTPETNEKLNIKYYVIIIISWVLWVLIFALLFTPKIKVAIEQSGVINLWETQVLKNVEGGNSKDYRIVTALFYDTKGAKNYTIHAPLTNTDKYHDTIEGLLLGPSQEILAQHAITYIAKETKLLGLIYSKGIVYVDLSKEFNDEDEKAVNQIEGTLKNFSEVKKVVILKDSSAIKQ